MCKENHASSNKMRVLRGVLTLLLAITGLTTFGQTDTSQYRPSKNSLYFEAAGNTAFWSFNYERMLLDGKKFKIAGRVGVGYFAFWDHHVFLPFEVTGLIPRKNHYFEFGTGLTFWNQVTSSEINWGVLGTIRTEKGIRTFWALRIGYRYRSPRNGLLFRAGLTPLYAIADTRGFDYDERRLIPVIGIAIGGTFRAKRKK